MTKNDNNPLLRISQTRPQKGMFAEGDVCPVLTRKKKGCLVVAVVFGLAGVWLFAQLLSALSRHPDRPRPISCRGHHKHIGLAVRMYQDDNEGWCPDGFPALVAGKYLAVPSCYVCPNARTRSEPTSDEKSGSGQRSSYRYFGKELAGGGQGYELSEIILACDRPGNHEGHYNLLFADGCVRRFNGDTIEEVVERDGLFLPGYSMPEKKVADTRPKPE